MDGCSRHQKLIASSLLLSDDEAASSISEIAKLISYFELLRNHDNMSTNILPRMCPASRTVMAPISEIYAVKEVNVSDGSIQGRVLDPQWIDSSLSGTMEIQLCATSSGPVSKSPL